MRATEFLTEGTEIHDVNGDVFAKRSFMGKGNKPRITMFITKDEWQAIKDQQANTEMHDYDIATAEMIIKDMVSRGAEVYWKTAADFNQDARELENHRWRDDPKLSANFDAGIGDAQDKARATTKATMKTVEDRKYAGAPLEKGGTSIPGNAAPAVRDLFAKGHIKPGEMVLDFGAGKFARNANYLREKGVKVYAYDPYNGTNAVDGWEGVSRTLPTGRFHVAFTSFVLNVVPDSVENDLINTISGLAREQFHITRNKDITATIKGALARKDKLVGDFFLTQFANDEEKRLYTEEGIVTPESLEEFVKHGVQTSKGFQRIPFLEEKGFTLVRNTGNFKVYKK